MIFQFYSFSGSRPVSAETGLAETNDVQISWGSNMAMASMVPNVTFLLLNASFGHHFKTTPRLLVSLERVKKSGNNCNLSLIFCEWFPNYGRC